MSDGGDFLIFMCCMWKIICLCGFWIFEFFVSGEIVLIGIIFVVVYLLLLFFVVLFWM